MNYRTRLFAGVASAAQITRAPEDDAGAAPAPVEAPAEAPAADEPDGALGDAGSSEGESGSDATPPVAGAPAEDDAGDEEPKPKRVPWQQKRMDALTAKAKTEEEGRIKAETEAADTRRQLAAYEALYGKPDGAPAPAASAPATEAPEARTYTAEDVRNEAARIANFNALNEKCETMFAEGTKKYPGEFEKRINSAREAFGDDLTRRVDFFQALTGLENGADVYHALVGDLDHFADVLTMPPVQMGMELAKLSVKVASAKPRGPSVSRVPAPIDPIDGSSRPDTDDLAKVGMDDYAKIREKQRAERAKERGY